MSNPTTKAADTQATFDQFLGIPSAVAFDSLDSCLSMAHLIRPVNTPSRMSFRTSQSCIHEEQSVASGPFPASLGGDMESCVREERCIVGVEEYNSFESHTVQTVEDVYGDVLLRCEDCGNAVLPTERGVEEMSSEPCQNEESPRMETDSVCVVTAD